MVIIPVGNAFALLFYTMARDMLSLDAYMMPKEWQDFSQLMKVANLFGSKETEQPSDFSINNDKPMEY